MDIKPFRVVYKSGSDRTIKPGLHGHFATLEEAKHQLSICAAHFGGGQMDPSGLVVIGPAISGVIVDESKLDLQRKAESQAVGLEDIAMPDPELTELEQLRAENLRLKAERENKECEESSDTDDDSTMKGKRKKVAVTS